MTSAFLLLPPAPASRVLYYGILLAPLTHNELMLLWIRSPRQRLDAETDSGLERLYRKITANQVGCMSNKGEETWIPGKSLSKIIIVRAPITAILITAELT